MPTLDDLRTDLLARWKAAFDRVAEVPVGIEAEPDWFDDMEPW